MLQPTNKPKRGVTKYNHPDYGEVWYNNTRGDGMIIVCDSPAFRVTDNYHECTPESLVEANKPRTGIAVKVKVATPEELKFKMELNVFFASQILQIPARCENCNQPFTGYTKEQLRGIVAHILPKSLKNGFPTVAIHPKNRLFLGTKCGCHNRWDNTDADVRATMTCYPIAIERYQEFKGNIPENKIGKAEDYLKITA